MVLIISIHLINILNFTHYVYSPLSDDFVTWAFLFIVLLKQVMSKVQTVHGDGTRKPSLNTYLSRPEVASCRQALDSRYHLAHILWLGVCCHTGTIMQLRAMTSC